MYQCYYNKIKVQYGDKVKLCYTNTDSLFVKIKIKDVNADFIDMAD
jgi:hypothetical protein